MNEFKYFLCSRYYDVVGICETKFDTNVKLKIPAYKCYTCNRNNRGGGVAIVVRENIGHSFVNFSNINNIEIVAIKLPFKNEELYIFQIYIPPNKVIKYSDLVQLFKFKNMIVMGDLNCKREEWNCKSENARGKTLLDFCIDNNIFISSPMDNTNFPPVGEPSIIDIFL